jgi:hypothetical protein
MRSLKVFLFSLLLIVSVNSYGRDDLHSCEALFISVSQTQVERAATPATFRAEVESLKPEIQNVQPFGRSYDFKQSLALVASYLPPEIGNKFLADAAERFYHSKVSYRDIGVAKGRLKYRSRFLDWSVQRSDNATIQWSNEVINNQEQLEELIEATIDIYSEASFIPIRHNSIYLRSPKTFMAHNIDVMKEKLILKMFVLGDRQDVDPDPGAIVNLYQRAKSIFAALLPIQFGPIRTLRLTQKHVDIFKTDGPQGLYRYLKYHEGLPLAVRYWFQHLTNLKAAVILTYASVVAPQALDTWQYFADQTSFDAVSTEQYARANTLYQAMQNPPDEVVKQIQAQIQNLSPDEQQVVLHSLQK